MYYTYILQSKKDKKWYTGATDDLRKRLMEHNQNEVQSTKSRGPFDVIYYEACKDKQDAFIREKYLKSGQGKKFLKNRIKRFLSLTGQENNGVHPVRNQPSKMATIFNGGFATLEVLIAFAVLILCISAVIFVIFGNQSIAIDSETNNEAISKAQALLEKARADSREDFDSVVTTTISNDDIYQTQTIVPLDSVTDCGKNIQSVASWIAGSRVLSVDFMTHVTDIAHALTLGGDCDDTAPVAWDNPISDISLPIGGQGATSIDAKNNFIYLTSAPNDPAKEDFFVYKFDPSLLPSPSSLTELKRINTGKGLNDIDVARDINSNQIYAYVLENDNINQFKVINVTDSNNPVVEASATQTLPNFNHTCSPPSKPCMAGQSIFFYNNRIYIGTGYLQNMAIPPTQNNELHVYDVSNPTNPVWEGSFNVDHNVNDIVVRNDYAYLATSDDNAEVYIYNISDPTNISFEDSFDTAGDEDGQALYLLGDKLYLGRDSTPSTREDFYVFDVSNPSSLVELGSKNLNLNPNALVVGIVVKGSLAFIGLDNPTSGLQILNVSDPSAIVNHTTCSTLNFSENSTAIDMEGDFIFSANRSNDEIRVIRDQSAVCVP